MLTPGKHQAILPRAGMQDQRTNRVRHGETETAKGGCRQSPDRQIEVASAVSQGRWTQAEEAINIKKGEGVDDEKIHMIPRTQFSNATLPRSL
jgi:hypothetical protein